MVEHVGARPSAYRGVYSFACRFARRLALRPFNRTYCAIRLLNKLAIRLTLPMRELVVTGLIGVGEHNIYSTIAANVSRISRSSPLQAIRILVRIRHSRITLGRHSRDRRRPSTLLASYHLPQCRPGLILRLRANIPALVVLGAVFQILPSRHPHKDEITFPSAQLVSEDKRSRHGFEASSARHALLVHGLPPGIKVVVGIL